MKILEIREKTVPLNSAISNAYINFSQMTASIVSIVTDQYIDGEQIIGFGFNSNGRYGQGSLMRERLFPRIYDLSEGDYQSDNLDNIDPFKLWNAMLTNEKPGGHGERAVAVGTIDMAIWDLVSKIAGKPLWKYLSEKFNKGNYDKSVFVYAAGGYYQPDKEVDGLIEEIQSYIDLGFSVVKIKVGGGDVNIDIKRIEAALNLLGSGKKLAIDANGRFNHEQAVTFAEIIEPYKLRWYEEPGDPLDFDLMSTVAKNYYEPLATGENLFSLQDATNLIRYGGLRPDKDILQFDPALSYGLVEFLRIIQMLESSGWSRKACIPHGGHLMALNIAAGLGLGGNESYPGVFEPFGGFFDGAKVEGEIVKLHDMPGIGFEGKSDLINLLRTSLK
ncbi:MAG: mandelate racemase [Rhodospirillaceae bacterium]|nr:mandelate racemase [Rhodospirillaceae bacterium]|tara:strand:+ start:2363 stop:3529 length:1167 start_codon:yes stop_codon:yes gene_type:complete